MIFIYKILQNRTSYGLESSLVNKDSTSNFIRLWNKIIGNMRTLLRDRY